MNLATRTRVKLTVTKSFNWVICWIVPCWRGVYIIIHQFKAFKEPLPFLAPVLIC